MVSIAAAVAATATVSFQPIPATPAFEASGLAEDGGPFNGVLTGSTSCDQSKLKILTSELRKLSSWA
jgi:hypothetical protein